MIQYKKRFTIGLIIGCVCLLFVSVFLYKHHILVSFGSSINGSGVPAGRNIDQDLANIAKWTATNVFVSSYGTAADPDEGVRAGHAGAVSGVVLKDHTSKELYCAFPYGFYLPPALREISKKESSLKASDGRSVNLLSYYLQPGRNLLGVDAGGDPTRNRPMPLWYMEIKRTKPVQAGRGYNPAPVTDTILAIIDDRGPLTPGSQKYNAAMIQKGLAGTIDCSPAVLRSLGVQSLKISERTEDNKEGDRVDAKLIPVTLFTESLYVKQFRPLSAGGVVIEATRMQ